MDRRAAARDDAEPALAVGAMTRAEAEVVDRGERVIRSAQPSKAILNLRGSVELERMAQQVARHRLGVGRDVEHLVGGHARVRAAR